MTHSIRRALAIVVLLAALAPAALLAQTPEPVTSESTQSIVQTELGDTRVDGTDLVHVVKQLDIAPGAPIGPLINMTSVVLTVQEGQLLVTPKDGHVTISVGTGEPILSEDGITVCDQPTCTLETNQPVVIAAGNGFSITNGTLQMKVVEDESVAVLVSMLIPESALRDGRCWICPGF